MNLNNLLKILSFLLIITKLNSQHIKISAIGDIIAHDTLQYYALATEKGYLTLFEPTKFIFLNDHLTIANLETPICDSKPISNYPLFNAHSGLASAIKSAGIEVVSTANNHSFDKGYEGVSATIDALQKENILFSGIGKNPIKAKEPIIFLVNGVTIAYLAATFSLNGLPYKEDSKLPAINYYSDEEKDINDFCEIIKEYSKIVDVMIVSYHCGIEYQSEPTEFHTKIYKKIAEAGANVVLIHHPHVLQKIEYYTTVDNREVLIAYSLGNFISDQPRYDINFNSIFTKTAEGIILQFEIFRYNNRYYVINPKIIPIFNIRFKTKINKRIYNAFEVLPIQYIFEKKYDEKIKDYITDNVLELVNYRLNKITELIKIEVLELKN